MNSELGASRARPRNNLIRAIAAFKFLETLACVGSGFAALKLLDPITIQWVMDLADTLPLGAEQHVARMAIAGLVGLKPHEIKALGIAAFLFAGIFLLEGIGLWMEKRWAEWFSVIATALFIPLEVTELFKHATVPKGFALLLNLVVVGILIYRIKQNEQAHPLTA